MILSYNPMLNADAHRVCAGRQPDESDREIMARADAVLLPQGRQEKLYHLAAAHCAHVFPNYAARYSHPGKIGDIELFRELALPHPATDLFHCAAECSGGYLSGYTYPLVIKSTAGGEGSLVFAVHTPDQAQEIAAMFAAMERSGPAGFLVQEYVDCGDRTLRVVVINEHVQAYWRVQPNAAEMRHNLAAGAQVDRQWRPELMQAGVELVRRFCRQSQIHLAGVDVLFRMDAQPPEPLLLEVNYYFGREGLGGSERYFSLLQDQVDRWLLARGLTPPAGTINEKLLLTAEQL